MTAINKMTEELREVFGDLVPNEMEVIDARPLPFGGMLIEIVRANPTLGAAKIDNGRNNAWFAKAVRSEKVELLLKEYKSTGKQCIGDCLNRGAKVTLTWMPKFGERRLVLDRDLTVQ
jgi:hypothetical protein